MTIKTVLTCPLGATCEKIVNNEINRCMWYTQLAGADPQTGEPLEDVWRCAMSWLPILLIENAMTNRGQTSAIESFRNETTKTATMTNDILIAAVNMANQRAIEKQ